MLKYLIIGTFSAFALTVTPAIADDDGINHFFHDFGIPHAHGFHEHGDEDYHHDYDHHHYDDHHHDYDHEYGHHHHHHHTDDDE